MALQEPVVRPRQPVVLRPADHRPQHEIVQSPPDAERQPQRLADRPCRRVGLPGAWDRDRRPGHCPGRRRAMGILKSYHRRLKNIWNLLIF
jgi:hypothetical protein